MKLIIELEVGSIIPTRDSQFKTDTEVVEAIGKELVEEYKNTSYVCSEGDIDFIDGKVRVE